MSWRQVTVLGMMLAAGLCCGLFGHRWDIAGMLFTGAIGYAAPDRQPWKGQLPGGDDGKDMHALPSGGSST